MAGTKTADTIEAMKKIKTNLKILIAIVLIIACGSLLPSRFLITTSTSVAHRVFFVSQLGASDTPRHGEYVQLQITGMGVLPLELEQALAARAEKSAVKRIACSPGDFLESEGGEYFCNEAFIGKAKDHSLQGTPTKQFLFSGTIPPGEFFVMGDHEDSYDSRYFGFVKRHDILARLLPLW